MQTHHPLPVQHRPNQGWRRPYFKSCHSWQVSCHNNVRLHTSVVDSLRWAPHYGAKYTVIYVVRAGTRSGNASAPTLVLLSVRQTFPDRSRIRGAEGQFACVYGVAALNSQSCHANIRPVTSHFVYKPPDPDFTFVKPECCEYVFRKPAHVAAKPVHQTLFRCSSDRPSLAGSAFAKPKIDPSVVQKITSQSSWLMWDVRFGEFLLLCL